MNSKRLTICLTLAILWSPRGCFTSDECKDDQGQCEDGTETGE